MTPDEIEKVADRIAENAAHIDAATHTLLHDIRVFDELGGWHRMGAKSCAHFLSWRIGLGRGAAREHVRVARALPDVPAIDDALRQGKVSYSKVRALTRVATPGNEAALLNVALHSTAAQLEHTCRLLRRAQNTTADPQRDRDRRWVTDRSTGDGMVSINLRLRPDEAALVMRAICDHRPADGDRADGAVALAGLSLARRRSRGSAGDSKRSRGNAEDACCDAGMTAGAIETASRGGSDGGTSSKSRVMAPGTDVMITIDAETLTGETCLADGVSAETCRRILCDAGIVPAITDHPGHTLDIGRKTRVIPTSIRRAMHRRDGGCRFPGCDARHVDGHHVEHWLENGETKLDNLISLCRFHHTRLHDGDVSLEIECDEFVFRDKWGRVLEHAPPRPAGDAVQLRGNVAAAGIEIDAATYGPGWDGTTPDYEWIIHGLCN